MMTTCYCSSATTGLDPLTHLLCPFLTVDTLSLLPLLMPFLPTTCSLRLLLPVKPFPFLFATSSPHTHTPLCLSPSSPTGARYGPKKSLIILTSGATAGAAEEFVYIMKKLGRAMIVGETTAGASHPPETFCVGETDVYLSIPTIHSDTASGPAWEGAGIAPHIPVPADTALDTAKGILNKHFAGQK